MQSLQASKLNAGDIIFTRNKASSTSWLIRAGTMAGYSHAILYVEHYSFIDSDADGVHSNNLQRLLFERSDDVIVKRLKRALPAVVAQSVCDYARSQVGQQYSKTDALRSAYSMTRRAAGERQFCSRLVAQAYATVGIHLAEDVNFCTPGEIFACEDLVSVDDVYRNVTEAEVVFATDESKNKIKQQESITNDFLQAVRDLTGTTVSTFEAVVGLVLTSPRFDDAIADLLEASGYLTMWKWDIKAAPYWYDPHLFATYFPLRNHASVANEMIPSQLSGLRRFETNLQALIEVNHLRNSRTCELFIDLEKKLCELSVQRLSVLTAFC